MPTYPIGTLTFVVSENHYADFISDLQAEQIMVSVADYFTYQIKQKRLDENVKITGLQWTRVCGCITVIISVGAVAAVGGGFAAFKFLKEYKDVRGGILKILEDMKNIKIWVKRKLSLNKKLSNSNSADTENEKVKADDKAFEVMFEETIKHYKGIPEDQRKYWSAGQNITMVSKKGEYCRYTLALKREDIEKPVDNEIPIQLDPRKKKIKT